jgi:hypothetical protein
MAEGLEQVKLVAADEAAADGAAAGGGGTGAPGVDRLYRPLFRMIAFQCGRYLDDPEAFEANFNLFRLIPRAARDRKAMAELRLRRLRRQLLPRRGKR